MQKPIAHFRTFFLLLAIISFVSCGKRSTYFSNINPTASGNFKSTQTNSEPDRSEPDMILEQTCELIVPINGSKPRYFYKAEIYRPAGTDASSSVARTAVVTETKHPALKPASVRTWTVQNVSRSEELPVKSNHYNGELLYQASTPLDGYNYEFFLWIEMPSRVDPVSWYGVFALEPMLNQKIEVNCKRFYSELGAPLKSG